MWNVTEQFGQKAGQVWNILNQKGPSTQPKIIDTTRIDQYEFCAAIGWLARENKICKHGSTYKLGESNLTAKIGTDAGKVWEVLNTKGQCEIYDISRYAKMEEQDVYAALGWLARENKIDAKVPLPKQYQVKLK
jgi:hypothetical protein